MNEFEIMSETLAKMEAIEKQRRENPTKAELDLRIVTALCKINRTVERILEEME